MRRKEGTSTHEKQARNPGGRRRGRAPDPGERIAAGLLLALVVGGPLVTATVTVARAAMRVVARESVMVATRSNTWSGDTGARCALLDTGTVDWPYDASELTLVYADTDYASGVWDLADVPATMAAVTEVGAGPWVARLPTLSLTEPRGTGSCYWASWAAMDDVLERNRGTGLAHAPPFQTMGLLPTADPSTEHFNQLQPCHLRWLARRVRFEADEHDDAGLGIVRGVMLDEPWKMLDTPDTWRWQPDAECSPGSGKASVVSWTKDDFAEVAAQFQSGTYTVPTADHSVCAPDPAAPPADCPTGALATTIGGADVELWFRVLDVAMPRMILPSLVLGMPADPDHLPPPEGTWDPTTYCLGEYGFCEGDSVEAWWSDLLDAGGANVHKVVLEYFYVVSEYDLPLDLDVQVNGVEVAPEVYDDASGAWTSVSASVADTSIDQVVQRRYCIGGTGCGGGPWSRTGTNEIRLELSPTDIYPLMTDKTKPFTDRLVYVWGARLRFLSAKGEELAEMTLTPGDVTVDHTDAHDVEGAFYVTDNADWRVADLADGVVIAMSNSLGLSDDLGDMGRSGALMFFSEHAYREFVKDACDDLGATPCLVEVRGADSSAKMYDAVTVGGTDYPRAPLWAWKARMEAADDYADGILAMGLPLDDPNAGTEAGRWAWKGVACSGPDDSDCTLGDGNEVRLVEQRNTVLFAGAHEEFDAFLADSDPACEGKYQVDVDVTAPSGSPKLHWWVYRYDGVDQYYEYDDYAVKPSGYSGVYFDHENVDFYASLGDIIRLFWVSEGGGGSPVHSTRVRFTVTPPTPGCAIDWTHTSSVDTGYLEWESSGGGPVLGWHAFSTTPKAIYDCITGFWSGDTGACP